MDSLKPRRFQFADVSSLSWLFSSSRQAAPVHGPPDYVIALKHGLVE